MATKNSWMNCPLKRPFYDKLSFKFNIGSTISRAAKAMPKCDQHFIVLEPGS